MYAETIPLDMTLFSTFMHEIREATNCKYGIILLHYPVRLIFD